jgi:hypothetical protein
MAVPVKFAGHEAGTFAEYSGSTGIFPENIGQAPEASWSKIELAGRSSYAGSKCVRAWVTYADAYARAIFNDVSVVQTDTVWFGMALLLPRGFYDAQQTQVDVLRWDDLTNQMGITIPFSTKRLTLDRVVPSGADLVTGPQLCEEFWHYIEAKCTMHGTGGSASNELWVNGVQVGSGTGANMPAAGTTYTRLRAGIVATGSTHSNDLELYFDSVYANSSRQGPAPYGMIRGGWARSEAGEIVTTTDPTGATWRGGLLLSPLGAVVVTTNATNASWQGGLLRSPDHALVTTTSTVGASHLGGFLRASNGALVTAVGGGVKDEGGLLRTASGALATAA